MYYICCVNIFMQTLLSQKFIHKFLLYHKMYSVCQVSFSATYVLCGKHTSMHRKMVQRLGSHIINTASLSDTFPSLSITLCTKYICKSYVFELTLFSLFHNLKFYALKNMWTSISKVHRNVAVFVVNISTEIKS